MRKKITDYNFLFIFAVSLSTNSIRHDSQNVVIKIKLNYGYDVLSAVNFKIYNRELLLVSVFATITHVLTNLCFACRLCTLPGLHRNRSD